MRPIDIARQLKVSTTTLRGYEALGLLPPAPRSPAGFRIYTDEHLAYFIAIREMMAGFGLTNLTRMLGEVMAKRTTAALWLATAVQAELRQERIRSQLVARHLLRQHARSGPGERLLTVAEVSRETGIPATTIRYWDKIGLISAESQDNNYRLFDKQQFRRVLAIHILKLSIRATHQKHFLDRVRKELLDFNFDDRERIAAMLQSIDRYLDQVNRDQIKGIAALYSLCQQVEANSFQPEP